MDLIKQSGWSRFPPRLDGQPIFYPVCNQRYAEQIARDWNAKLADPGYVVGFAVDADFLARYPIQTVGSAEHQELWVPAEELEQFNERIVGKIWLVATFEGGVPDV